MKTKLRAVLFGIVVVSLGLGACDSPGKVIGDRAAAAAKGAAPTVPSAPSAPGAPTAPTAPTAPAVPSVPASPVVPPPPTDGAAAVVAPAPASGVPATIAADGFPAGQQSPEGAACDFARSFITPDAEWFAKVCFQDTSTRGEPTPYRAFLESTMTRLNEQKSLPEGGFRGPQRIAKVFVGRGRSPGAPAPSECGGIRLSGIRFVDMELAMSNNRLMPRRTLVVQREDDHLWYVIARPDLLPPLNDGLLGEPASTEVWMAPGR